MEVNINKTHKNKPAEQVVPKDGASLITMIKSSFMLLEFVMTYKFQ